MASVVYTQLQTPTERHRFRVGLPIRPLQAWRCRDMGPAKFQIRTIGGTPEEFGAFLKGQWAYWGDALKDVAAQAK